MKWDIKKYVELKTWADAEEYFRDLDLNILEDFIDTMEKANRYTGLTFKDHFCLTMAREVYKDRSIREEL